MYILKLVSEDKGKGSINICCSDSYDKLVAVQAELVVYRELYESAEKQNTAAYEANKAVVERTTEYKALTKQMNILNNDITKLKSAMGRNARKDNVQLKEERNVLLTKYNNLASERSQLLELAYKVPYPEYKGVISDFQSYLANPAYESYEIEECQVI